MKNRMKERSSKRKERNNRVTKTKEGRRGVVNGRKIIIKEGDKEGRKGVVNGRKIIIREGDKEGRRGVEIGRAHV